MQCYANTVTDRFGNAIQGATVVVNNFPSGTMATLFTDPTGAVPQPNPIYTDINGTFQFAAVDGDYTVNITSNQTGALPPRYISLFDAATVVSSNVDAYGADPTGATDSTAAFARCVAAQGPRALITLSPGTYVGSFHIYRSNVSIVGAGSGATTIKAPVSSTWTGQPAGGVIELGNSALGNSAPNFDSISIEGLTVDGQRSLQPTATDDIHGWGLIATFITHGTLRDVRVQNCPLGGGVLAINSNFWNVDLVADSCGNTSLQYPGFDINASKFINLDVVANNCQEGARILQNSYGINGRVTANNCAGIGFVYANNPVTPQPPTPPLPPGNGPLSASFACNLDVAAVGCGQGAVVFEFPNGSNARISTQGCGTGVTVFAVGSPSLDTRTTNFEIATYQSLGAGVLINSNYCNYKIISEDDGYTEPYATTAVVDCQTGTGNKFDVTIRQNQTTNASFTASVTTTTMNVSAVTSGYIAQGQTVLGAGVTANTYIVSQLTGTPGGIGTYQLSASMTVSSEAMTTVASANYGFAFRAGTTDNELMLRATGTSILSPYFDSNITTPGNYTTNRRILSGSAGSIAVPMSGLVFAPLNGDTLVLTGTNSLLQIQPGDRAGCTMHLVMPSGLSIFDHSVNSGSNFKLPGGTTFTASPNSAVTVTSDGYFWYMTGTPENPVNVDWFGADNTGVADSTAAFTAAFNASKIVRMSPGTYSVTGLTLTGTGGWTLEGAGSGATTLKVVSGTFGVKLAGTYTGSLPAITVTQSCNNNNLRGFAIDISNLSNSTSVYGLNTVATFNNNINDVRVIPHSGASTQRTLRMDNASYTCSFYSCNFGSTTGIIDIEGHNLSDAVTTAGFYDCSFAACTATAATVLTFSKPVIQGSSTAFTLASINGITITGGDVETTGTYLSIGATVGGVVSINNTFSGTATYLSGTISSGYVLMDQFGSTPFQFQMAGNSGFSMNGPIAQQNTDNSAIRNTMTSTGAVGMDWSLTNSHGSIFPGMDGSGNYKIDVRTGGKATIQRSGTDYLGIDASNNLVLGTNTSTTATTGANGAPPAQVAGYGIFVNGGSTFKFAYYNV